MRLPAWLWVGRLAGRIATRCDAAAARTGAASSCAHEPSLEMAQHQIRSRVASQVVSPRLLRSPGTGHQQD